MNGEKAFDDAQTDPSLEGHAYHYNLPSHYVDKKDGIPLVTKYADRKAKAAVKMAYSIQLSHDLFIEGTADDNEMDCHGDGIHDEGKEKNTWVSSIRIGSIQTHISGSICHLTFLASRCAFSWVRQHSCKSATAFHLFYQLCKN